MGERSLRLPLCKVVASADKVLPVNQNCASQPKGRTMRSAGILTGRGESFS